MFYIAPDEETKRPPSQRENREPKSQPPYLAMPQRKGRVSATTGLVEVRKLVFGEREPRCSVPPGYVPYVGG